MKALVFALSLFGIFGCKPYRDPAKFVSSKSDIARIALIKTVFERVPNSKGASKPSTIFPTEGEIASAGERQYVSAYVFFQMDGKEMLLESDTSGLLETEKAGSRYRNYFLCLERDGAIRFLTKDEKRALMNSFAETGKTRRNGVKETEEAIKRKTIRTK